MKIEIEQEELDDLKIRAQSYGFCLSAMVRKHGKLNKHTGQYEYYVTLPMFEAIAESKLFTTNEIHPVTNEVQTKVHIKLKELDGGEAPQG
jgi:hypothetical protein